MLNKTLFLLFFCAGTLLAKPTLDESAAKQFIVESSDKFATLYQGLGKIISELESIVVDDSEENTKTNSKENKISSESNESDWTSDEITGFFAFFVLLAQLGKLNQITDNITTLADETYRFPVEQFQDEEAKIGILKLRTMPGLIALGDQYEKWTESDLSDYLETKNLCEYNKKDESKCDSEISDLIKVLKTSSDSDELLYYWKEFREKNLPELTKRVTTFIDLYKKLGEKFKTSAKFAWFATMLDENFDTEMEKVIEQMQPLYKELHAYVRRVLHEQYGDKVPATGYIPHHLYEQVASQAWKKDSVVTKEFHDVKMPIEENFKETSREIIDIASNFMKSLGLSELPEQFYTDMKEFPDKTENCDVELFESGNVTFFRYCSEVNIKRFLQMHGYIARVHYANERKDLPFAYTDPYHFELATGEAVILAASTPKYLHKIGHKDVDALPENEDMNRLFRMGVHTLFSIPEYFINAKVFADVLDNKVPFNEMNKHYWDLMKKYVGVAPPVERSAESIDFPPKFYKNIEDFQDESKFVSEVVGYQIYQTLCEKSGEYVKGVKDHKLHNCNFYNSKVAGNTLKEMMQVSGKKPWKKLLSIVSGDESGMKAEPILNYYEPLQNWLSTKNQEHKVKVGWE